MKRFIILLLVSFISICAIAQNRDTDILYLKDGSIIKGLIVEIVPEDYLKIKMADGSIFVYKMEVISKIAKAVPTNNVPTNNEPANNEPQYNTAANDNANYNYQFNVDPSFNSTTYVKCPTRGYRGWGETAIGGNIDEYGYRVFSSSTVHGYQINPNIFVGIGVTFSSLDCFEDGYYDYCAGSSACVTPFADVRFDIIPKRISPFCELRVGGTFGDLEGFYLSPSVGVRFNRVSLSLAYQFSYINNDYYSNGYTYVDKLSYNDLSLRISVDFGGRQ